LFTGGPGLRFEPLEKWLRTDPTEFRATLGNTIHLLREDKTYTEWEFTNAEDLEKLRDPILSDLRKYALPFIERYSRLADFRRALESPNKQDWFDTGLDVDSRVTVLAAIRFVEGDKAGAIKTLEDGLKTLTETLSSKWNENKNGLAHELRKRSFAMEYMRKRLIENG
jgi:hypothetical protein